uniref:cell division cycle protein 20 homolog isoform X2 n=1 Tax=Myxine glutinosa TaxID=7769 RepID=UPI00358EFD3D
MAHFGLENDIKSLLMLDTPIANGPMARWQRKTHEAATSAQCSFSNTGGASPSRSNRSLSLNKTPGATPGKARTPGKIIKTPKGAKTPKTPKQGLSDRFIPLRSNASNLEISSFLVTKENEEQPENNVEQNAMALKLNGFDLGDYRILRHSTKAPQAPEDSPLTGYGAIQTGYQSNLRVLYSQSTPSTSSKQRRYIPLMPERVLDAPGLIDDYYLNLVDWGDSNRLAVALAQSVYVWYSATMSVNMICQLPTENDYCSSVAWMRGSNYLALGTKTAEVQIWDVETGKRLRTMQGHGARVGALSWNAPMLSSGSRFGTINHHDVRAPEHVQFSVQAHQQEVCGLAWSPNGQYLASGGNDNAVSIWPTTGSTPVHTFTHHHAAVKALSWCPWLNNVLATGGGTIDRHIRIWNVSSGNCLSATDTGSQVSGIQWSAEYKEMVSSHGFVSNQLVIWKYPTMTKVIELQGHQSRILSLCANPDGSEVVSAGADETIRLWRCFAVDAKHRKKPSAAPAPCGFRACIR